MIAIQYLEPGAHIAELTGEQVSTRLRVAFQMLPIGLVILGWDLPEGLVEACARVAQEQGARLYLWHPLLTGGGPITPRGDWQTVGLHGESVPGFQDLAEFTFLCPNRPEVAEAVLERLRGAVRPGIYQGAFLDRIRYPSPAADPGRFLACFCGDCQRTAAAEGLDLSEARRGIQALLAKPGHLQAFVSMLLDPLAPASPETDLAVLGDFMAFRMRSIRRMVQAACSVIHAQGLAVGLDCFSPCLAAMVGQDPAGLDTHGDWIKIMSYAHTHGPAGLPYELAGLVRWLAGFGVGEVEAFQWLASATRLPLPSSLVGLKEEGLPPEALFAETRRARTAGVRTLLTGIELVDLEGVTKLNPAQIAADLAACRAAAPDGLALSWDLQRMPLEWLKLAGRAG